MAAPIALIERRGGLTLIGAACGAAVWAFVDILPGLIDNALVFAGLACFAAVALVVLLGTLGPLTAFRALSASLAYAGLVAACFIAGAQRFGDVQRYLETQHPLAALALAVALGLPFLAVALAPKGRLFDYARLFDAAWTMLVRTLVAGIFTLAVWTVIWLSDSLLQLVGLGLIEGILDIAPVPFVITGLSFGLAVAVCYELADFVSPHLPLRLVRLLLPVVLAVGLLFVIMLPFRGLTRLFEGLSAAGVLSAMALAGMTLVASALDRDDLQGVSDRVLGLSARAMAGLIPILALLALWAIGLRIAQYGVTPNRLAGGAVAGVLTLYGLGYLWALAGGNLWRDRLRAVNARGALGVIVAALLWLSPLMDPQAWSARDQVARLERGMVDVAEFDLDVIDGSWGRAGQAALERLAALDLPDAAQLQARLDALRDGQAGSEQGFADGPALAEALLRALSVRPEGAQLPPGTLDPNNPSQLRAWLSGCQRRTPAGNPGCVALVSDLMPAQPGDEVVILTLAAAEYVDVTGVVPERRDRPRMLLSAVALSGSFAEVATPDTLDRVFADGFSLAPVPLNALQIQGAAIIFVP